MVVMMMMVALVGVGIALMPHGPRLFVNYFPILSLFQRSKPGLATCLRGQAALTEGGGVTEGLLKGLLGSPHPHSVHASPGSSVKLSRFARGKLPEELH